MVTLQEFILAELGVSLAAIPVGKVLRFKQPHQKFKTSWVLNKGEVAFIGNFASSEKPIIWKSEQHEQIINKMDKFARAKYYKELQAEQEKAAELDRQQRMKDIAIYWDNLPREGETNDYFVRKKIEVQKDFRYLDGLVVVPMYSIEGAVIGCQNISSNFKWNASGSLKQGAMYPIRNGAKIKDATAIFVCEGLATGLSLQKLANMYSDSSIFQVICCFDSGNIPIVVNNLRGKYKGKFIIGCADNDEAGIKAMNNARIPYMLFGDKPAYDCNDACIDSEMQALDDFFVQYHKITTEEAQRKENKNKTVDVSELDKFNDIVFDEEPHKYYLNGKEFTSATTLLHEFSGFDSDAAAERVAKKEGKTKQEILDKWQRSADFACKRGTRLHHYLEYIFGGEPCQIGESAKNLYPIADQFKQDIDNDGKLTIIKQEFRLYDEEWQICGTVDALGIVDGYLYLIDWKTNKKFNKFNSYGSKLLGDFSDLDDCELHNYSLQLSLYKLMIERNTKLKIKGLILVHFTELGYTKYKGIDYTERLTNYLNNRKGATE